MKNVFFFLLVIAMISSCTTAENDKPQPPVITADTAKEKLSFFPVTAYIKGQLYDYKIRGKNPLKYTTIQNRTDSVWLKQEEVETAIKEFLTPEIDSVNLTSFFTEKKFKDETLESITFTYEPSVKLPDSMQLRRWDVYIDPETNKVKRIYLVKEKENNRTVLLTWRSEKWCTIVTILNNPDGSTVIEKEEKISWDF